MFRPHPETPLFQNLLIRQIVPILIIVGVVVGVLLVFSLEHQSMVVVGLTEGKTVSSELNAAVGQSRRDLIAITLLLFIVGGVGISSVVTYLHYANTKQDLEEVKGLARHILESIPTGVLTVSEDGVLTAANPTAESILERPAASLLGKHYDVVFGEGHPIEVLLAQIIHHGGSMHSKEITFDAQNGEVRTIRISSVDLTGDNGKPAGMIFQLHDVTEWLALEKQVNEAQRLTALHTLSAGVAHELRNPLSALDLNLHLLEEEIRETTDLSCRANNYFQVLNTELSRLSTILDNIMRYAQSRPAQFQNVNIQSLVSHVTQLLQHEAEDRNQQLQVSVPTNLPDVQGDETQIAQALINIVINAFQAMSAGGVCRIIVQERERQERHWVEIAVHDTGQGIDPQSLVHIFDPFYTTKENGTGLGLAVAHRILQNHGGRIDVAALPGDGTSVMLSLPVAVNTPTILVEGGVKQETRILVVDDEINIRNALVTILEKAGYRAQGADSAESALTLMKESPSNLLITDVKMPGIGGIALVPQIKSLWPATEIIVITAYGSIETAVEAMRLGAYDFLTKPIDRDRFSIVVQKALDRHRLAAENQDLRRQLETRKRIEEMIGESEAMRRIHHVIGMVAKNDVTILIGGESGTGKELVARAIHEQSQRSHGPFITMNCGALPESLFESELFGYEKGAFSGAVGTKPGRFEMADEGTLFLDELGELPLKAQVDFLRVLETGEFRRLGGKNLITVNTRIIAATNRNLAHMVETGQFREDLFYRINVVPIHLPPLRERREDIPVLLDYFLKEFAQKHRIPLKNLSLASLRFLVQYHWPGNIRQLRNVIERLVVTVKEHSIQPDHLPDEIRTSVNPGKRMVISLGTPLEDIEREVIRRTLVEVTHHREQAAKLLGISVRSLQYKIKEYGIEV